MHHMLAVGAELLAAAISDADAQPRRKFDDEGTNAKQRGGVKSAGAAAVKETSTAHQRKRA